MARWNCAKAFGLFIVLGMLASPLAGLPARPVLPLPPSGAKRVTVGPGPRDFATIREALEAVPAGSVLELAGAVFTQGELEITKDVFIRGAASSETILQAGLSREASTERVLRIAEGVTAVLSDLSLRYGHPTGACPRGGGGIYNTGILWMERCLVSDNEGQCGGGIENRGGSVTAFDCLFLRNETVVGMTENKTASLGSGGGIKNSRGDLYLESCTFAFNKARKRGGAVKNSCNGRLTMRNCTLAHNESSSGALHSKGELEVDHCTIAYNRAPNSYGAGLFLTSTSVIRNSIVAGNDSGDFLVELEDPKSEVRIEGLWLGRDLAGSGTFSGDPLLGPLGDTGGPTWTCLLLPGSPAIDAGAYREEGPRQDQRGLPRPSGKAPDLGAVEMQP